MTTFLERAQALVVRQTAKNGETFQFHELAAPTRVGSTYTPAATPTNHDIVAAIIPPARNQKKIGGVPIITGNLLIVVPATLVGFEIKPDMPVTQVGASRRWIVRATEEYGVAGSNVAVFVLLGAPRK